MLKISHAASPRLSQLISAQRNVSRSPKSPKKYIKPPILEFKVIQGHWIRWQSRASVRLPISD